MIIFFKSMMRFKKALFKNSNKFWIEQRTSKISLIQPIFKKLHQGQKNKKRLFENCFWTQFDLIL